MALAKEDVICEAREVLALASKSIDIINDRIDDSFFDAVELISSSRNIYVSGVGKSGMIARKIAATFASYGFSAFFLHPVEALHGDIGVVRDGDTAILLSKSGSTDDITKLVPFLKSRSVKIIGIIGKQQSYLGANADILLDASVEKEACPFNIAPTISTIAALAIGDALAVCAMKYKGMKIEDFARNHPQGQIGRNLLLQVKDVMHKNAAMPLVKLGDSFKDAIVEITNKGLGCVCIVDDKSLLKGIITDGDVRRTFQKVEDIRGLKAEEAMTANPITVAPTLYLGEALAIMENRASQISVLPVADDEGKCLGVIRVHDIIRSGL